MFTYHFPAPSRPLKKLPIVMGIRPIFHEGTGLVRSWLLDWGLEGHAAPMSLGSRMRL